NMRFNRKLIAVLTVVTLALGLVACGGTTEGSPSPSAGGSKLLSLLSITLLQLFI
ncbi:MAG: hypothetical protein GX915_03640, partial [Clostridiales bacterium]|nr:hypothetical protein [Clostridiales bacterium]